jgi:hypothetical protein
MRDARRTTAFEGAALAAISARIGIKPAGA